MNAPDLLDLDARIAEAELRLMAREDRLKHAWTALGERVGEATRPRRLAAPAAGAAALLLVLWWLRRRPPTPERPRHDGGPHHARLPWLRLVAFAWPLLPHRWRARVPPALAEAAVAFGPWALGLLGRRRRTAIRTVQDDPLP